MRDSFSGTYVWEVFLTGRKLEPDVEYYISPNGLIILIGSIVSIACKFFVRLGKV